MEDLLDVNNILDESEVESLFDDDILNEELDIDLPEEKESKQEIKETTEVDPESLFDAPEGVGSEDENQEDGEDTVEKKDGVSHKSFYSSIAKAFKDDGIFPDLDDELIKGVSAPEDFADMVEKQIQAQLDERYKRIDEALNYGVEPSEITKYEQALNYLNGINSSALESEDTNGENLRKQLIYQDYLNRGYTKERATKEVTKSFNAGSDIEDAKEALESNIEYFKSEYDEIINNAKKEEEEFVKQRHKMAEDLKTSILEGKDLLGGMDLDKPTRKKVYENISKASYKDPDTGNMYTAIQKYEKENRLDFMRNIGILFTLTDGFKNIDKLVKSKVNKEMKKSIRELEHTLGNTARTPDGNLRFVSGVEDDPESFIKKGYRLDI